MSKLTGKITCAGAGSIEPGSVATIQVLKCDAPSKTIGLAKIVNPTSFPLRYEVEYNANQPSGDYSVVARIERNGRVEYITDTEFSIFEKIFRAVFDFHVIRV